MAMQKEDFVSKMIHSSYLQKIRRKMIEKEIEAYVSDSKRKKYTYRVRHSTKKK